MRVVEVMVYTFEADHLLVKLWEYGDLLEKLGILYLLYWYTSKLREYADLLEKLGTCQCSYFCTIKASKLSASSSCGSTAACSRS